MPVGDLGGHVRRRARHHAGARQLVVGTGPRGAEVGELGAPVADEDVRRLDVAVHDARRVGGDEGGGELGAEVGRAARSQRSAGAHRLGEGRPVDVLHDEPRGPAVLDDVVDGDDVGVVERGCVPRLAHRAARAVVGLAGEGTELLDRHVPAEPLVAGQPHDTHAASPDGPLGAVPPGDEARSGLGGLDAHRPHDRWVGAVGGPTSPSPPRRGTRAGPGPGA
nr:hypothetical protein [Janibacter melonis]